MTSSVDLKPFRDLAVELRANGNVEYALALEILISTVWTSSSEYVGELGLAVVSYRNSCRSLPEPAELLVRACMQEVGKVWPDLGKEPVNDSV